MLQFDIKTEHKIKYYPFMLHMLVTTNSAKQK